MVKFSASIFFFKMTTLYEPNKILELELSLTLKDQVLAEAHAKMYMDIGEYVHVNKWPLQKA